MEYVNQLDSCDFYHDMYDELLDIIRDHKLEKLDQISLTSIHGENDWLCSIGKITDLEHNEKYYSTVNHALKGSKIESLIKTYKEFYRWRAMRIPPRSTYTIHKDGDADITNIRCHVPLKTNTESNLIFFGKSRYNKEPKLYKFKNRICI